MRKKPVSAPKEVKVYGCNACLAVFKQRPEAIRRVYLTKENGRLFKPLMQWCAQQRIAYHVVGADELEKVSASRHHEGVCLLAREKPFVSLNQLLASTMGGSSSSQPPSCLLYLDQVQNPHNWGAMIRVCAHFGVRGMIVVAEGLSSLPAATLRTAQGGCEWVDIAVVSRKLGVLKAVREAGFCIVATSSHEPTSLYSTPLPARVLLMMGSESHGLRPSLLKQADEVRCIPGAGQLESLNVASASAVFLAEYWRCNLSGTEAKRADP